mgnify:CR=1 FL=1
MKCIYHFDADGKCAGWLVYAWVKEHGGNPKPEDFIKMDSYSIPIDLEGIVAKDEEVWIVDFSLPVHRMRDLLNITKNVYWFDHHISAINRFDEAKDILEKIKGVRDTKYSGCGLVMRWIADHDYTEIPEYFKCGEIEFLDKIPEYVALIEDHDTWKNQYGKRSHAMAISVSGDGIYEPWDESRWSILSYKEGLDTALAKGYAVCDYRTRMGKSMVESYGFELEIEGMRCYIMNMALAGSQWFGEDDMEEKYDMLIRYVYNGKIDKYEYSLYSTKPNVNCAAIAERYGGGGHKGAAGFTSRFPIKFSKGNDKLPFDTIENYEKLKNSLNRWIHMNKDCVDLLGKVTDPTSK